MDHVIGETLSRSASQAATRLTCMFSVAREHDCEWERLSVMEPLPTESGLDPRVLSGPAALMAGEESWTIFRRFDEFNLLNLLILQDEIQNLTSEFKKLCSQATDNAEGDHRAWYMLSHPLAGQNPPIALDQAHENLEAKRREVWKDLKSKLREYSKSE